MRCFFKLLPYNYPITPQASTSFLITKWERLELRHIQGELVSLSLRLARIRFAKFALPKALMPIKCYTLANIGGV